MWNSYSDFLRYLLMTSTGMIAIGCMVNALGERGFSRIICEMVRMVAVGLLFAFVSHYYGWFLQDGLAWKMFS